MSRRKPAPGQEDLFALLHTDPEPEEAPAPPPPAPTSLIPGGQQPAPAPRRVRAFRRRDPMKLAEAVAEKWWSQHVGSRMEIPVGTVAILTLISEKDPDGPPLERQILALSPADLIAWLRAVRDRLWVAQPYLIHKAWAIHSWMDEDLSETVMKAVREVVRVALRQGILDLTGDPDPAWRAQWDVLGHVVTVLRSHGSRQGLGEYHTPPDVSDTIAQVCGAADLAAGGVLEGKDLKGGEWFADPAAGTGGLLRAAALNLYRRGKNPAAYGWAMTEIDPIAAACCAVNVIVWGLGSNALIACRDTLRDGDGIDEEVKVRADILAHRDQLLGTARLIAAVRNAERLLSEVAAA